MKNVSSYVLKLNMVFFIALFSSCGTKTYIESTEPQVGLQGPVGATGATGQNGANGTSCTAVTISNGLEITCGNSTPVSITNGLNGTDGSSCTASVVSGGADITCGTNAPVFLANGAVGATGQQGTTGATGSAGSSCTATTVTNGVDIICGTNPPVFLSNGSNGINNGIMCTAYTILASDYSSTVNWGQMFSDGSPKFSTVLSNFSVPNESDTVLFNGFTQSEQNLLGISNWALDCEGYLNIPETGSYTFQMSSDDGSQLVINNNVVINMPQAQAYATGTSSAITLYEGPQKINLLYFQGPQTNIGLTLQWKGPSNQGLGTMEIIPASAFTYQTE